MGLLDRFIDRVAARVPVPVAAPEPADVTATAETARDAHIKDPSRLVRAGAGARRLYQSTSAMFNGATGLGTSRDPSFFNRFAIPRALGDGERFGAGRNGLIRQALKKLPDTATRAGWRTVITDERVAEVEAREDISDTITAYEKRLGIQTHAARAATRANQYSEALVLLGVEDGRSWDQPVDWANVKTIRWAAVIDRRDFNAHSMFPATSKGFGKVQEFWITNINGVLEDGQRYGPDTVSIPYTELDTQKESQGGQLIFHADRVMHFHTVDYFSDLDSLQDSFGGYLTAMSGVTTAAREASMTKYSISKWIKKMWSENAALSQRHMELVDRAKNVLNAWVVDKEEEDVEFVGRNLSGVDKLPAPSMVHVSASLGQPVTEFWGVSPTGFSNGETAQQNWHATVHAWQDLSLAPQLMSLHGLILVAEDGAQQPRDLKRKILFEDLSPPDETTRSNLRSTALSDIRQLVKDGIIDRGEARPAVAALSDDYFRPHIDLQAEERPTDAPVGIFSGSVNILDAVGEGRMQPGQARALLLALGSSFFNEENVNAIVPDRPESSTLGGPAVEGGSGELPVDGEDESEEVDEVWSRNPLPSDALEAKVIAGKLGVPTVRITRAHRAGLIEGWNYLGGKPRYSYSEVERAILRGNGRLPAEEESEGEAAESSLDSARDAEPQVARAAVMLRLPPHLRSHVPYKSDDPSAPHLSLLYIGEIPPEKLLAVLDVVREVLARRQQGALQLELDGVGYFDGEKRVAYVKVQPCLELEQLHRDLRTAVEWLGIEVHQHPGPFVPHVTLAYMEPGEVYAGPVPQGLWSVDEAEVWYDDLAVPMAVGRAPEDAEFGAVWDAAHAYAKAFESAFAQNCADLSDEQRKKRIDEAFAKFHKAVNMGASELEAWAKTKWSKKASVSREPIARNLRLLRKPKAKWTLADATAANRTVSFVSRMKGAAKGKPVKVDGREGPSKRDISLKNWAFDPAKS